MHQSPKFTCTRAVCLGTLTIPLKILERGHLIIVIAICPRCHKKYKFFIPKVEWSQAFSLLYEDILRCGLCGAPWEQNQGLSIDTHPSPTSSGVKLLFRCNQCQRLQKKMIDWSLWPGIRHHYESLVAESIRRSPSSLESKLICPFCYRISSSQELKYPIPMKLTRSGSAIAFVGRCPTCSKPFKTNLLIEEILQSPSFVWDLFFHCHFCGVPLPLNYDWHVKTGRILMGRGSALEVLRVLYHNGRHILPDAIFQTICYNCRRRIKKVVTRRLWPYLLQESPEIPPSQAEPPKTKCCDQCGEQLLPGSSFCGQCGVRMRKLPEK